MTTLPNMPKLGTKPIPMFPHELPEGTGEVDFVYVSGDAYVDHPSFGTAIIARLLEDCGYTVGIIAQPEWKERSDPEKKTGVCRFGRPRLAFLVSAGNIDSMVAHYTAAKKKRTDDYYSPNREAGHRPDRATIVYCNRIREAYGDVPIIIGGLEASLRRFAHYDYWDDGVRRSILIDSGADILSYGMGEYTISRLAKLLDRGVPISKIKDVRGTVVKVPKDYVPGYETADTYDYAVLKSDKKAYADAFRIQYQNTDSFGKAVTETYGEIKLVQNPPAPILTREELDRIYAFPYTRKWHPYYDKFGGIAALSEVEFSITHNRGCFGACAFCAIAYHQGRNVVSRSRESVLAEAQLLTTLPGFKGYIHDVGGPTANFRCGPCKDVREGKRGLCTNRRCLAPKMCKNLIVDHSEYVDILRSMRSIPGIKKVFVRSGIRFDYLTYDKSDEFLRELAEHHVSGQLKVAPEHISPAVLREMGKPDVEVYDRFCKKYFECSHRAGLDQYLVPYLMSSHPGSTLDAAIDLALYLKRNNVRPEQVQDFYPTPSTASTTMYYTGIDPFTGKEVYVPKTPEEKKIQRALLQYNKPENRALVRKAIGLTGRTDAEELLFTHSHAEQETPSRGGRQSVHGKTPVKPDRTDRTDKKEYSGRSPAGKNNPSSRSSSSGSGRVKTGAKPSGASSRSTVKTEGRAAPGKSPSRKGWAKSKPKAVKGTKAAKKK